jgi:hypothetical protein
VSMFCLNVGVQQTAACTPCVLASTKLHCASGREKTYAILFAQVADDHGGAVRHVPVRHPFFLRLHVLVFIKVDRHTPRSCGSRPTIVAHPRQSLHGREAPHAFSVVTWYHRLHVCALFARRLYLTRTRTYTLTNTHSHSLTHTHSQIHTHSLSLSLCLSLSRARARARAVSMIKVRTGCVLR